ncbi:MAG TPA: DNA-3-methyladenine glycosylase 2 family protein [Acidobacteria bacterium]|nr:DNA-3-methyladenine glycosylase 2 family protein [Acidobacteriota bacterium]
MRAPLVDTNRRLTKARLLEGVDAVCAVDPDLARIAERFGPPPLWGRAPGYATLVQIILEQQVSLASAKATFVRMRNAFGEVTAEGIASLSAADIQTAGVTRQKASYCLGLAQLIQSGGLDLRALGRAEDREVRRRLIEIRGIGAWTADIYLLMALGRPDIWPDGDLALATAAQQVKRLRRRPDDARLRALAARWAPWRAVAARLLWHYYLSTRDGREPVTF